jgi:hypothetical protein
VPGYHGQELLTKPSAGSCSSHDGTVLVARVHSCSTMYSCRTAAGKSMCKDWAGPGYRLVQSKINATGGKTVSCASVHGAYSTCKAALHATHCGLPGRTGR